MIIIAFIIGFIIGVYVGACVMAVLTISKKKGATNETSN